MQYILWYGEHEQWPLSELKAVKLGLEKMAEFSLYAKVYENSKEENGEKVKTLRPKVSMYLMASQYEIKYSRRCNKCNMVDMGVMFREAVSKFAPAKSCKPYRINIKPKSENAQPLMYVNFGEAKMHSAE